ncbi:MAG: P63C domain-containing protein [Acidobacteria bacterium]|nr:P63C domain-containing protein [Acidobacteriota bacterium]
MSKDDTGYEIKRVGVRGGLARAAAMTPKQRSHSARIAAEARWAGDLPQATHDGPLQLGDRTLIAAVLPNGKRLLSQGTFLQAIGRSRTPKAGTGALGSVDGIPFFLRAEQLKAFISEELLLSTTPIFFRLKNGKRAVGYDAMLLPMVCEVYLKLRDERMDKEKPVPGQYKHIVRACDMLTRAFARVGIIALVDSATGYQADKAREDILKILEAYIAPHLMPWTRRFPHEFFREAYRILGWEYKSGSVKHPSYMGKFINKYVYDALPEGVLDELKRRLPKNDHGNRRAKLWQLLTVDTGIPHLDRQLTSTMTLLQIADGKDDFDRYYQTLHGRQGRLQFGEPPKRLEASVSSGPLPRA